MAILTGVRSGSRASFSSVMGLSSVRSQNDVFVNDDAKRPARPHFDGRLDIEILLSDLLAGLIDTVLSGLADGHDQITLPIDDQLTADAEQCRNRHALEQLPSVIIHLILKSG